MSKEINEESLKFVLDAILKNCGISDLDMYNNIFKDRISIFRHILENYFDKVEGSCCSGDKASHTARLVDKTLRNKEYYSLKETYGEYQAKGGNIGSITELDKIAYWCPETLDTTEDALKIIFTVVCSK
jgi:hypothetical protein